MATTVTPRYNALALARRGALIINIPHACKRPTATHWPDIATSDSTIINGWFDSNPRQNYGIVGNNKIGGIVGLDIDSPEMIAVIETETGQKFPKTFHTRTSRPEPAGHYLFTSTARSVKLGNCTSPKNFEWRAIHQQIVGPGSTHPSGTLYVADDINAPILDVPDWLVEFMEEYSTSSRDTLGTDLTLSEAEAEADVTKNLNWVIRFLNEERKNKDNIHRPVVLVNRPVPYSNPDGLKGFKIYVKCPDKQAHSIESGDTEACLIILPGRGIGFKCQHASHSNSDIYNWQWYRKVTELPDVMDDEVDTLPYAPKVEVVLKENAEDVMFARPVDRRYEHNDHGNTQRLRDRYGDRIRFVGDAAYTWNGHQWLMDNSKALLYQMVFTTHSLIHNEADATEDPDTAKSLHKWAVASGGFAHIQATSKLIGKTAGIQFPRNPFDHDKWLLNVRNGTINLLTQELQPHRKEDMISKMAPVTFAPGATCPSWDNFLLRIMDGDMEMVKCMARICGYTLTGSVREEAMFLFYGLGANGKTTLLETFSGLLGHDYSHTADHSILAKKKFDSIPLDIAALRGRRMVILSETESNESFNEAKLKKLCSHEQLTGRELYQSLSSFDNTHKLFLGTNHMPKMVGTDNGLWRRLKMVGFEVTIPEAEQDKDIQHRLAEEYSGILNWALKGLQDYTSVGLAMPEKSEKTSAEWRNESDPVARFIDDSCETGPACFAQAKPLHDAYKLWSKDNREAAMTKTVFRDALLRLGYKQAHKSSGTVYVGLQLVGMSL